LGDRSHERTHRRVRERGEAADRPVRREPEEDEQRRKREGDRVMADILYLGVTLVFFWLSWLFVGLCERL